MLYWDRQTDRDRQTDKTTITLARAVATGTAGTAMAIPLFREKSHLLQFQLKHTVVSHTPNYPADCANYPPRACAARGKVIGRGDHGYVCMCTTKKI